MRRLIIPLLILAGCTTGAKRPLKVAASAMPHAEMLEYIQERLENEGVDLDIIVVDDYHLPNPMLADKEVDANFFEHLPFLNEQKSHFGYRLIPYAAIHLEPMGLYSKKIGNLADLPNKSTVAIPNDPTNEARALRLLEKKGLIQLKDSENLNATVLDISDNPKELKFLEIDASLLPRTLRDVALAVINSNLALAAGLDPDKDPLAKESADSPYANILVIRKGDENRPDLKKLKEAMTSDEMRAFILSKYKGAIIPVF